MSVAISWANKMQLAKCDIMVGFPISSHICYHMYNAHALYILMIYIVSNISVRVHVVLAIAPIITVATRIR